MSNNDKKPFYKSMNNIKLSSQIVNESRYWLQSLTTKRPYTPLQDCRTLFGIDRNNDSRPSSTQSIHPNSFDILSRPSSSCQREILVVRNINYLDDPYSNDLTIHCKSSKVTPKQKSTSNTNPMANFSREKQDGSTSLIVTGSPSPKINCDKKMRLGPEKFGGNSKSTPKPYVQEKMKTNQNNKNVEEYADEDSYESSTEMDLLIIRLHNLKNTMNSTSSNIELLNVLQKIYNFVTNSIYSSQWVGRSQLLKSLFQFVDVNDAKIQLYIIQISLYLKVSGRNLLSLSKLLYKLAKDSKNDSLFEEHYEVIDLSLDMVIERENNNVMLNFENLVSKPYDSQKLDLGILNISVQIEAYLYLFASMKFLVNTKYFQDQSTHVFQKLVRSCVLFHNNACVLVNRILPDFQQSQVELRTRCSASYIKKITNFQKNMVESIYHVLVQVTDIFCRISMSFEFKQDRRFFIDSDGILQSVMRFIATSKYGQRMELSADGNNNQEQLVPAITSSEYLVQLNWTRLLSHLTEHADICAEMNSSLGCVEDEEELTDSVDCSGQLSSTEKPDNKLFISFCDVCFTLMNTYKDRADFMVRMAFVLGNLCARCPLSRRALFGNEENVHIIYNLVSTYYSKISDESDETEVVTDQKNSYKDVLVKLVRLVSNAAIDMYAGTQIASHEDCFNINLKMIESPELLSEELILNCLFVLNNLTFYSNKQVPLVPDKAPVQIRTAKALLMLISLHAQSNSEDYEIMLDVMRVFGNLSRHQVLRAWLTRNCHLYVQSSESKKHTDSQGDSQSANADESRWIGFLLDQLAAYNAMPEVCYASLGVLINFMADKENRAHMFRLHGLSLCIDVLKHFCGYDWQLATLTCKLIWNTISIREDEETDQRSHMSLIPIDLIKELKNNLLEFTDKNVILRWFKLNFKSSIENNPGDKSPISLNADDEIFSDCIWTLTWEEEFLPVANELINLINALLKQITHVPT